MWAAEANRYGRPADHLRERPAHQGSSSGPSATLFRAGETLRLVVAGRWLWPVNPLTGQFPAAYQKGAAARCTLHWGPEQQARLPVPVIP